MPTKKIFMVKIDEMMETGDTVNKHGSEGMGEIKGKKG